MAVDQAKARQAVMMLLEAIGEDPRPGIEDTPARVGRWWAEFIDYHPGKVDTAFDVVQADQMVVVSGVRVWSLCEHHLLPFYADLTMSYLAKDRVLGLSKLGRIAHGHAHRLQIQERLVADIADDLQRLTGSPDVAVLAKGEHLCMTMRGIRTPAMMHTSVMRGAYREQEATRAEFMAHVS